MKRRDLIRKIAKAARAQGVDWTVGEGGSHSVCKLGGHKIPIPRHNELNEMTARGILKSCEVELGEGWWR